MTEIDDATKKAVRAAIKETRAHLKNCEMILKGWVPDNSWPYRSRWSLSQELHEAGMSVYRAQCAVLDQLQAETPPQAS